MTSNPAAKMGLRRPPYAFTEHGVAMLSSVLRSPRAVAVNIEIMRAFFRPRQVLAVNTELARRLDEVEQHLGQHDQQFVEVIRVVRQLLESPPASTRRRIGFDVPRADYSDVEMPGVSGKIRDAQHNRRKRAMRHDDALPAAGRPHRFGVRALEL